MKKETTSISGNIAEIFEDQLQADLFNSRCHDSGDSTTGKHHSFLILLVENAKIFKEEFLKRNVKI